MKKLSERLNELAIKVAGMEKKIAAAQEETSERVEARVEAARADAESRQDAFQARINEEQAAVALHWEELQANFHSQVEQIKSNIDVRQDAREYKRAMRRADDAEMYAEAAIGFVILALDEAEIATLEAIEARAYAESLV